MTARLTPVCLALACLLAGCASTPKEPPLEPFVGGDPKHLATDEAACRSEAQAVDFRSAAGYSDSRYGATAAMAAAVAQDNPNRAMDKLTIEAAFESCMNAKGWKRPNAEP